MAFVSDVLCTILNIIIPSLRSITTLAVTTIITTTTQYNILSKVDNIIIIIIHLIIYAVERATCNTL